MSYRQNFRGRQDNRFRYNGPPGRGGRGGGGGFSGRSNAGVGEFIEQRRDTFPQHGRQQNQNKPSVNQAKTNASPAKTEQSSITTKPKQDVTPLMDKEVKELPKNDVKEVKSTELGNVKGNHVEKAAPTPKPLPKPVTPAPAKKAPTVDVSRSAERPGPNKRPNTGYQGHGNQQNRSNQGVSVDQGAGRNSSSDRGRFDNKNNQERKSQQSTRFSSPGHGQLHQSEAQLPQPMHTSQSHPEFGDDLITETRVEKKFTGRCRLFIGNLPNETTDDEFKRMFDKFGEINEVFLNKQKMFGFIRLDTRLNAEAAKNEMDGATFKGRIIRVRFAAHGAALKIKNLPPMVSNELLEEAFSNFGEVERAIVIVDDRGKSTSEGIVEFARKPAAQAAIKKIKEGVFLMTASTRPISVEPLEQKNDEDGLPEKNVSKNQTYYQEREAPPRFAQRNSFENEWGQRWKQQALDEEKQRAKLETKFIADREKLMEEGELARHDYHTMQMRQELLHRQKELERLEDQRKDLEARRQGLQRQREERFGPSMMDPGNMMRQQQEVNMQMQQTMEMQQAMRGEDMNRREADRYASGGGSSGLQQPPPPLPPSLMMDSSDKRMMGQNQENMQNQQRPSRFDVGPGGVPFNGNGRGSIATGGMGAEGLAQQENVMGVNFGSLQGAAGMGNNPRPLMEEMSSEMMGDFANAKRPRRF